MRSIALPLLVLAAHAAHADDKPEQKVLARVNAYRAHAGLPPVKVDAKLSKGCTAHAEYMKANRGTSAVVGLEIHNEHQDLPGATPEGAACGKAADIYPEIADLPTAVDGWMASLYHRRPILSPTLTSIGVGYARLPEGTLMAAMMFAPADETSDKWPIEYPADKQTDVPLEFGNEIPNPVPGGGRGGYPVTIQFPSFDKVTGVKATLADDSGKAVALFESDPEHPATSFGQYGVVCLIPKQPLRPQTTYTATVTTTWKDATKTYAWSFTTVGLRAVDADDEAAVLDALGVASRVHGKVAYAGMMDANTVFLALGHRDSKKYKMLSVIIPAAVWKDLAGTADPKSFAGKLLDVDATPELVQNTYVNLPIAAAAQVNTRR